MNHGSSLSTWRMTTKSGIRNPSTPQPVMSRDVRNSSSPSQGCGPFNSRPPTGGSVDLRPVPAELHRDSQGGARRGQRRSANATPPWRRPRTSSPPRAMTMRAGPDSARLGGRRAVHHQGPCAETGRSAGQIRGGVRPLRRPSLPSGSESRRSVCFGIRGAGIQACSHLRARALVAHLRQALDYNLAWSGR